ncbi:MAG TPA: toprim domain-containing protein [Hyphomicrobiaceae bacterium]|nr:toprim domain-containing protein [Hyphomicrobiaceae bacterium]
MLLTRDGGFAVYSFAGDDWRTCRDYVCERLGLGDWRDQQHAKQIVERRRVARRNAEQELRRIEHEAQRRRKARSQWGLSLPIAGTVAETYLRECRGITIIPPTLRFLQAHGEYPPAMIAPFGLGTEPEPGRYEIGRAAVHAVHLTRLLSDGSGKAPEINGRSSKTTHGMPVGPVGWPIALVPPNDVGGLAIAEGIEDALSLHQATGLGAWVAGSAVRLPKLAPLIARLPYIEAVTIAADDDAAGSRYATELVHELHRLRGSSIEVHAIKAWEGRR